MKLATVAAVAVSAGGIAYALPAASTAHITLTITDVPHPHATTLAGSRSSTDDSTVARWGDFCSCARFEKIAPEHNKKTSTRTPVFLATFQPRDHTTVLESSMESGVPFVPGHVKRDQPQATAENYPPYHDLCVCTDRDDEDSKEARKRMIDGIVQKWEFDDPDAQNGTYKMIPVGQKEADEAVAFHATADRAAGDVSAVFTIGAAPYFPNSKKLETVTLSKAGSPNGAADLQPTIAATYTPSRTDWIPSAPNGYASGTGKNIFSRDEAYVTPHYLSPIATRTLPRHHTVVTDLSDSAPHVEMNIGKRQVNVTMHVIANNQTVAVDSAHPLASMPDVMKIFTNEIQNNLPAVNVQGIVEVITQIPGLVNAEDYASIARNLMQIPGLVTNSSTVSIDIAPSLPFTTITSGTEIGTYILPATLTTSETAAATAAEKRDIADSQGHGGPRPIDRKALNAVKYHDCRRFCETNPWHWRCDLEVPWPVDCMGEIRQSEHALGRKIKPDKLKFHSAPEHNQAGGNWGSG